VTMAADKHFSECSCDCY